MPKQSAGILCYRRVVGELMVLLVHPGGPFWAKKDAGAWSIPKGGIDDDEEPLDAARREFEEETGATVEGKFIELEPVRQTGGKIVYACAVEADFDPARFESVTFKMEWPPKSGKQQTFPEIDRAEWFTIPQARLKMLEGQTLLLDQLVRQLAIHDRRR
jgi:predicted NUDIX family NTP pyrophosphohydrolase